MKYVYMYSFAAVTLLSISASFIACQGTQQMDCQDPSSCVDPNLTGSFKYQIGPDGLAPASGSQTASVKFYGFLKNDSNAQVFMVAADHRINNPSGNLNMSFIVEITEPGGSRYMRTYSIGFSRNADGTETWAGSILDKQDPSKNRGSGSWYPIQTTNFATDTKIFLEVAERLVDHFKGQSLPYTTLDPKLASQIQVMLSTNLPSVLSFLNTRP